MAASVLLIVGPKEGQTQKALLDKVIEKAAKIQPGTGPGKIYMIVILCWNSIKNREKVSSITYILPS